ncbi:MAG: flavin reductase family protein [Acidobacteriota bacterium]|nr:flavin reductase family protein [Acidobacteriota bacterium]
MSSHPAHPRGQPVAADLFRRACAQFATGIAVVTVLDRAGAPHGMTINSFASVSLDPALVLICIDDRATILPQLLAAESLAINVLAEHQSDLSSRFARKTEDRFEQLEWTTGELGSPIIAGTLAVFECTLVRSVEAGDHHILIAAVQLAAWREARPLLYFNSSYQALGE